VPDDLVTKTRAVHLLGCAEAFVVRRVYAGALPGVRLPSGRLLVHEDAVWDLMDPACITTPAGSFSELRAAHRGS
jgi:hypothetical protein